MNEDIIVEAINLGQQVYILYDNIFCCGRVVGIHTDRYLNHNGNISAEETYDIEIGDKKVEGYTREDIYSTTEYFREKVESMIKFQEKLNSL